jgi:large subunit ribosomal protein L1
LIAKGLSVAKHGKKYEKAVAAVTDPHAILQVKEALGKVKSLAYAKFDESVDVNVNLSIDASKGDQVVRSSVLLPHGRGKKVKVLVFAKGDYAEQAEKAGADYIGAEDLVEKIESGWMDFTYAIATPDLMGLVGRLAKILGPRGLLPNKKVGTVTFEIERAVEDLKKGRMFFKNDKSGIVHFSIGRVSFSAEQLYDNLVTFARSLVAARPPTVKGKFLKKMVVSSTMGLGFSVNTDELLRS